jgi:subtilisin family serine protease
MFAFRIEAGPSLAPGNYRLTLHNQGSNSLLVDAFKWDDRSGWGGVSRFVDFSDEGTVTWPGTAHGVIVVGAYSPREGYPTPPGELNTFSGRGRALDGRRLVDVTAPGSYTFSAASSRVRGSLGDWQRFSGTSAALPHVAGTVALLLQAEPEAHPTVVEEALTESARGDSYTGNVPNASWGFGKLDAAAALELLSELRGGGPGGGTRPQVRTGVQGRAGPPAP